MLTFNKMQKTSPLMYRKYEIWGQSSLKVIQAFHTVRIVLYIGRSVPVAEDHWTRTPDIQNYAYSMKSLINFQNAPAWISNLFLH